MNKINRKTFFQYLSIILLAPFGYFSFLSIKNTKATKEKTLTIGSELANGIHFTDDVVIIKTKKELRAYSARCTHLGCTINQVDGDKLVCPCHGSEYDLFGNVVKGPSIKTLHELPIHKNKTDDTLIIKLS